jgi:hypothetical protein
VQDRVGDPASVSHGALQSVVLTIVDGPGADTFYEKRKQACAVSDLCQETSHPIFLLSPLSGSFARCG